MASRRIRRWAASDPTARRPLLSVLITALSLALVDRR